MIGAGQGHGYVQMARMTGAGQGHGYVQMAHMTGAGQGHGLCTHAVLSCGVKGVRPPSTLCAAAMPHLPPPRLLHTLLSLQQNEHLWEASKEHWRTN